MASLHKTSRLTVTALITVAAFTNGEACGRVLEDGLKRVAENTETPT